MNNESHGIIISTFCKNPNSWPLFWNINNKARVLTIDILQTKR